MHKDYRGGCGLTGRAAGGINGCDRGASLVAGCLCSLERSKKHGKVHREFNHYRLPDEQRTDCKENCKGEWYPFMLQVLQSAEIAACVEHLRIEKDNLIGYKDHTSPPNVHLEERHMFNSPLEDQILILDVVETSSWIPAGIKTAMFNPIIAGNESPMIMLALTRLSNLKRLAMPASSSDGFDSLPLTMDLMLRAARAAAQDEKSSMPSTRLDTPFQKLEHVEVMPVSLLGKTWGVPFAEMMPLLALPSMRILDSAANRGGPRREPFRWPDDLPRSRLREVNLSLGLVTAKAMATWAQAFRGPCVFRQTPHGNGWGPWRFVFSLEFDYFEIPFEGAGREDCIMRLAGKSIGPVEVVPGEMLKMVYKCFEDEHDDHP